MGDKIKLFDESDQEEQDPVEFRTNKSYAKHYDEFRKKEILGQLKNLEAEVGSSDSSDDETTDEEIVDENFDKEFFRTLAFLKRKDKNKYNEKQTFFENVQPVEEVALTKRHRKEKPMTVKDYERKVILEKGGVFEDEEEVDTELQQRSASPTLVEEEQKIKDEIKQALSKIGDDDSDGEESGVANRKGGGLLKERVKSDKESAKEQADYIKWLADKKANEPPSEEVKALEPLKHFWNNEKLSKEDAFLKDYILNKRFVQTGGEVPSYDEIVATSEDEEELEKQEEYERRYNFRFEEPDTNFIKQYPRTVDDSVRVERNKRKEQRKMLKERKEKEKEQQRRELEELKAVKLREIRAKIQRLKDIAATDHLPMNEDDLESDFDPEEHDRRMQTMFNDEYYTVDEGDQKPEFPDMDQELGIENYDVDQLDDDDAVGDDGPHCEDDDFIMDCDYEEQKKPVKSVKETHQQELLQATRQGKKKGRRQSKFREVLKAEKPLFDPEDEKTYGEYIDEYYKLDYEDMIGDLPCRFRYVETVPNDFGLTIEEILTANTRDLNKWASVKKTVQIRPKHVELNELNMYKRKAASEAQKRKILPSLFAEAEDDQLDEEIENTKQEIDKASTSANEKQKNGVKSETITKNTSNAVPGSEESAREGEKSKKKKRKPKKVDEETSPPSNEQGNSSIKTSPGEEDNGQVQRSRQRDSNMAQKRKWEQSADESQHAQTKIPWSNKKNSRFARNGHHNRQNGNQKTWNAGGPAGRKEPKKAESAADQRLRAFGLNPTKFHNKQLYSKQRQPNREGKFEHKKQNGAPMAKRKKFE